MKQIIFSVSVSVIASVVAAECFLPLDVMFLQDSTGSLEAIIGQLIDQIPLVYAGIASRFPDTFFGVAEFQDKPYWPLGESDGFCYKLGTPLTDDMSVVLDAYNGLYASGGGDGPEAQFQAIINAALDPAIGWRPIYKPTTSGPSSGGRIIIMATDSLPHLDGDMAKFVNFPDVPQGLPPNSGIISTDDISYECLYQEYPSPEQLKAALQATNTSLITITPNDPSIVLAWTWVNSDLLGQSSDFYHRLGTGSNELFEVLVDLLGRFSYTVPCSTTLPPGASTASSATEPSTTSRVSTSGGSTTSADCQECSCTPPGPCTICPPGCDAAVLLRLAKEPKKLQVIVNNE